MGSWFCRSLGKEHPPHPALVILWAHFWLVFERGSSEGDNFICYTAREISWIVHPEGSFQKAFFNHLDHTFSARSLSYHFFLRLEALTKKGDFWWSCEEVLILFSHITQHALWSIRCSEVCVVETRLLLSHLLPNRQQKKTKKVKFMSCVFLLTFFCLWKWNHDGWGRRSVLFREHQEMGAVSALFILKLNQHLFDFTVDYSACNYQVLLSQY